MISFVFTIKKTLKFIMLLLKEIGLIIKGKKENGGQVLEFETPKI